MGRYHQLRLAFLSAAVFMLAACAPAVTPAPNVTTAESRATAAPKVSIPLEGTEWVLASVRGDNLIAGPPLALAFYPDSYMEGSAGCNSYGADYTVSGQEFHIAQIHRTHFDCEEPPGIMLQDRAFFEALASVAAYRATGDSLEFDDASGETILVYTRKLPAVVDPALEDTEWSLESLNGGRLLDGSRITLNLGGEGFGGYSGCNNYGGKYGAADGGALRFGSFAVTAMACSTPEGVMEQEQAYVSALSQASTYRLQGTRLEIQDAAGRTVLVFARKDPFDTDPSALVGTAWRLASVDGESVSEDSIFTLAFYSEYILGGHAGCRDYLATYQATGDNLNLLFESMFDVDCRVEDPALEQEVQFLDIMAPKADLRLGEGELEIYGERGGVLVFEPPPKEANLDLEGPTWSLLAFVGPNPYAEEPEPWPMPNGLLLGTAINLTFEGDAVRGSAGCNSYGAAYSRAGSSLSFETASSTKMACLDPVGVMEQEARYLELITAVTSYHIYGDRLWLDTGDGQALVFFATGQ